VAWVVIIICAAQLEGMEKDSLLHGQDGTGLWANIGPWCKGHVGLSVQFPTKPFNGQAHVKYPFLPPYRKPNLPTSQKAQIITLQRVAHSSLAGNSQLLPAISNPTNHFLLLSTPNLHCHLSPSLTLSLSMASDSSPANFVNGQSLSLSLSLSLSMAMCLCLYHCMYV